MWNHSFLITDDYTCKKRYSPTYSGWLCSRAVIHSHLYMRECGAMDFSALPIHVQKRLCHTYFWRVELKGSK